MHARGRRLQQHAAMTMCLCLQLAGLLASSEGPVACFIPITKRQSNPSCTHAHPKQADDNLPQNRAERIEAS